MMLLGVDYHPSFQQIAFFIEETGECGERELNHSDGGAERFYRDLKERGISVRVGMEATGYARWFERLLAELGFELWIGDPAQIKAKRVKKQKYDREDARLLLRLMREDNFPQIWVPSPENRDLRQLLWHRHRLVQMRTRIMNQLQALAMNENKCWKNKLWSERGRAEFEKLPLGFWASRRRQELLELLDRMNPKIEELATAVEQEVKKRPDALRLMVSTHLENWESRRAAMQDVCYSCHATGWVQNFYKQYEGTVALYNEKFAKPAKAIMDKLYAAKRLTPTPFDEKIEWIYYELWHHEGRRARMGTAMMGPDYTQWHGFYEVAKCFYTEFIPEAERLLPGVTAEVMKSDFHKWTGGLSKEQIQQQIDFYKERYKQ